MVTKLDYSAQEVNVCLSVMVELLTILGEYRNNMVLVGEWVPYFLLIEKGKEHTGSIDIDLALDFNKISDNTYKTILQLLKKHGYKQGNQPFIFNRIVESNNKTQYKIEIDCEFRLIRTPIPDLSGHLADVKNSTAINSSFQ